MDQISQTFSLQLDSPERRIFRGNGIFVAIACLLLLTLQFQTTPIPLQAQIMPFTSLLAVVFLPFVLHGVKKSPLLLAVLVFALFAVLHSLIGLLVDLFNGQRDMRFISWLRQVLALVGGVSTFVVMRAVFQFLSDRKIVQYIIWGSVPVLVFAFINVLWGGLGQAWAGSVVISVREFIAPLGYTAPLRASGFSTEPSTFAAVLAVVLLPLFFVRFEYKECRRSTIVMLFLALIAFAWTFSASGVLLLVFILLVGGVLGPKRTLMMKTGFAFILAMSLGLVLFPANQILKHARYFMTGKTNLSFTDRFYSTFGPMMTSYSSFTMLGYGLGGTVTHFKEIVPKNAQAEILAAKWKQLPNLGTLIGRIFAETGAVGFILFSVIIIVGLWEVNFALARCRDSLASVFLKSARLGLYGTAASLAIVFGSFHMPYLWLWLAIIDTRFLVAREQDDADHQLSA